jgi:uncharacterized membrane protein (UPF0127 family)
MKPRTKSLLLLALLAVTRFSLFGGTVVAAPAVPAWRADTPWTTETATVMFAEDVVIAEVADTSELRERGLGFRDTLVDGTGMLFVYDSPSTRSFWMKGMRFCLDIVWIEEGTIRGASESVCPEPGVSDQDLTRYVSPEPVTYVLELPAGWLDANGYQIGSKVDITLPPSSL